MQVVGFLRSKSRRMLEQALKDVETDVILYWGKQLNGLNGKSINNIVYKNATEQLTRYQLAGLTVPDWTTDLTKARQWSQKGLVFGRDRVHSQGKDIVGPTSEWWASKAFWIKVIPPEQVVQEWRVHVFGGKMIQSGLKYKDGPPLAEQAHLPIRNKRNGWRQEHRSVPPPAVVNAGIKACTACEYEFGAVDMLLDTQGTVWVLETNLAPGMDENTCERYVEAIKKRVTELAQSHSR